MLGTWQLELSMQIIFVVVPVAVYFLILGLLNSQSRPQLLTGRLDFALLAAAIAPLCIVPLLGHLGASVLSIGISIATVAGIILLLAPRRRQAWVIYNINYDQALRSVERALRLAGVDYHLVGRQLELDDGTTIRVSAFPLLRNVSLTVQGHGWGDAVARFEAALAEQTRRIRVTASPMAVSFVLLATVMIVAPLVLLADRMPEVVRVITDMIE